MRTKEKVSKTLKILSTAALIATLAFTLSETSASAKTAQTTEKNFVLEEATIEDMQKALRSGKITSKELTQMYIDRINQYDKAGPKINSVLEINPDAIQIAEQLDKNRKYKAAAGPLYGIPVIVKDNIDTADKMHTSAGSIALKDHYAAEDSFVAKKLREAGAIIIGKANMTEWANFMTSGMPSGYSSRGGQVLNPYGPTTFTAGSVGGSSAGTGASVASNFAAVGIGTETSGSILSPASANSLVGIKPTVGLVSRTGIIPIAHSQDTAGPMTRTVEDAAILLDAIAGFDKRDEATKSLLINDSPNYIKMLDKVELKNSRIGTNRDLLPTSYTKFLQTKGLKGARIGIDRSFLPTSGEELNIFNKAIEDMKAQGAIIVDNITITRAPSTFSSFVLFHEFKHDLNAYLSKLPEGAPVRSLAQLVEFNKQYPSEALKYGQTILERSLTMSDNPTDPAYLENRALDYKYATEGINGAMEQHNLDALLFLNNRGASMPAKAGYPSITVPAGYTSVNRPVGVTFSAKAYSEATLIKFAYSYEQATKARKAPEFPK